MRLNVYVQDVVSDQWKGGTFVFLKKINQSKQLGNAFTYTLKTARSFLTLFLVNYAPTKIVVKIKTTFAVKIIMFMLFLDPIFKIGA